MLVNFHILPKLDRRKLLLRLTCERLLYLSILFVWHVTKELQRTDLKTTVKKSADILLVS